MPFPSPPWALHGQAWVSLFYVTPPASSGEPLGVYAAAFLDLTGGSTLSQRALVVARRVPDKHGRAYRVVDGWTDNAAAVEGSQSLFGFPVGEGSLDVEVGGLGPVGRAEWRTTAVAGAQFADAAGIALRTPLKVVTRQPRPDGPPVTATLLGSARSLLCLAVWSVPPEGPLGWLAGKQPFASFRLRDARLELG